MAGAGLCELSKYRLEVMLVLTFVVIFGGDGEHGVLDVLILVHLCLVQLLVEVWRVVILVSDADTDELGHCGQNNTVTNGRTTYLITFN